MTDPVNKNVGNPVNNVTPSVDPNLIKKSGMQFGEGTLKSLEEISIMNTEGTVLKRETRYKAVLQDGTIVTYPKQKNGAKTSLAENGDCDFEKLNNADIEGSEHHDFYNLLGCQFTTVDVECDKSRDVVRIGDHEDGTKSKENIVFLDDDDRVDKAGGFGADQRGSYFEDDEFHPWNGTYRKVDLKTGKTYSHDGKLLKDSYVKAKEQKMSDGYTIKTSRDRKEQWFFDPDGKQISAKQFMDAEHPYPVKKK